MDTAARDKWDRVYASEQHGFYPPCTVLMRQSFLLPRRGRALDLACGLGRNAIHLCRNGLESHAWDISGEAIRKLEAYAQHEGLNIRTEVRDIVANPPEEHSFDIIVVSHYLDRALTPSLKSAVKPGGLLFYQTFTRLKVNDIGPTNPDYLLESNELLRMFADMQILFYNENADIGDKEQGIRNEAMIVVRKTDDSEQMTVNR